MPSRTRHGFLISLAAIGLLVVWFGSSHAETIYTYDELNRLRRVEYEDGSVIEYTYDGAGNRLTLSVTQESISTPSTPTGPASGTTGTNYTYTTGGSSSSFGHSIQYFFDWGDGSNSGWLSIGQTSASKSWASAGNYNVRAEARCATHTSRVSSWSGNLPVTISTITVVSPDGGENWKRNSTHAITWSYMGNPGSYVKIELLKGGVLNLVITSSTSIGSGGSGSYSWRIPANQAQGSDYEIRVTSTSDGSYTDTSNNNFSITK